MTDKEWAEKIREVRSERGLLAAIHFARLHGFQLSWVLHALYPHHTDHTVIYPF